MPNVERRQVLTLLAALPCLVYARGAYAGSYLDRAAMLVGIANLELSYLRRKLYDPELARTTQKLAAARVMAAQTMEVPAEVVQAHPHLLLMLEDCERATNAAVERNAEEFLKFQRAARDEEEHFRAILKQLGWQLPVFP
jgi:hypothetical protein